MPDRGRRQPELGEVAKPGDPGLVAPDAGIIEDRRGHAELCCDIGRIDAAMRAVDDDGALGFGADAGDAVGRYDRRGLGGHGIVSRTETACRIMLESVQSAQAPSSRWFPKTVAVADARKTRAQRPGSKEAPNDSRRQ